MGMVKMCSWMHHSKPPIKKPTINSRIALQDYEIETVLSRAYEVQVDIHGIGNSADVGGAKSVRDVHDD